MNFTALYQYAPVWLQNFGVSLAGWRISRRRYGPAFELAYTDYLARMAWTADQVLNYQKHQIAKVLERASRSEYYSRYFRSVGANWQDFQTPAAFRQLPVITKDELRRDPRQFEARPPLAGDVTIRTSGTTGSSLALPTSHNVEPEQWAVWWRYRNMHGITRGERVALFASSPVAPPGEKRVFWRRNISQNETRFSIYHISERTVRPYVCQLVKDGAHWIHGNPSAIALLARHMVERGITLSPQIRWVTVGSENLSPRQSELITEAFGVRPIQHYGLAEANANISECPEGRLHVDEDFALVEFLPSHGGGAARRIVGTSFANSRTVLLRYDTGDLATMSDAGCRCGGWGRVVSSLDGRQGDYVVLPSGAQVASLATPFHATDWLAEGQIYQDERGALEVRIVPTRAVTEDMLAAFELRLRERIGDELPIRFALVDSVPRTPSGKIRLVISNYS